MQSAVKHVSWGVQVRVDRYSCGGIHTWEGGEGASGGPVGSGPVIMVRVLTSVVVYVDTDV